MITATELKKRMDAFISRLLEKEPFPEMQVMFLDLIRNIYEYIIERSKIEQGNSTKKDINHVSEDKMRLMVFIDDIFPDDMKCGGLSLDFTDDGSAIITVGNKEKIAHKEGDC